MRDDTIGRLCRTLDESIAAGAIDPENVSSRLEAFRPVEQAVRVHPHLPEVPDSRGGKVISALWYKTHGREAHVDKLLPWVRDEASIVRFAAVDALDSVLKKAGSSELDSASSTRARRVLEDQRAAETSPILKYQLGELATGLMDHARGARRPNALPVRANPYLAGLPVRDPAGFFGRTDVIDQIKRYIQTPGVNSVIIHGARRTGKTSLLHRLRHGALGDAYLGVYIDLQSVAGEPLSQLITTFINSITLAVRRDMGRELRLQTSGDLRTLAAFHAWLRDAVVAIAPTMLVVLLDEYEVMSQYLKDAGSARQFQALYEGVDGVAWVFAGARKVENLTDRSFAFLLDTSKYIRISFLSEDDTARLIQEPARDALVYSPEILREIRELTAGHPFYTQLLCQTIFELAAETRVVAMPHVEAAVDRFVADPSPHIILTWNALDFSERIAGATMATLQETGDGWVHPAAITRHLRVMKYPVALSKADVRQAMSGLLDVDFVVKRPGDDAYRIPMGLMRKWVAESRSLWGIHQQYQTGLLTQAASHGAHLAAFAIDAVLSLLIFVLAFSIAAVADASTGVVIGFLVAFALYSLSYAKKHGTPGMRFMDLRVRTMEGGIISDRQALLLGGTFVFRVALWVGIIVSVIWWSPPTEWASFNWIGVVGIALETAQTILRRKGHQRRGLYDRLTRTLVLRDPKPGSVAR